jgi:hypothetical protein
MELCRHLEQMNNRPDQKTMAGTPITLLQMLGRGIAGRSVEKFQNLRAKVMTKQAGTRVAVPHQDVRIPRSLALFHSPRGITRTGMLQ